ERLDASITWVHRRVAVCHADDRFFKIAVLEVDGAQHSAVRRARDALRNLPGAPVISHDRLLESRRESRACLGPCPALLTQAGEHAPLGRWKNSDTGTSTRRVSERISWSPAPRMGRSCCFATAFPRAGIHGGTSSRRSPRQGIARSRPICAVMARQ